MNGSLSTVLPLRIAYGFDHAAEDSGQNTADNLYDYAGHSHYEQSLMTNTWATPSDHPGSGSASHSDQTPAFVPDRLQLEAAQTIVNYSDVRGRSRARPAGDTLNTATARSRSGSWSCWLVYFRAAFSKAPALRPAFNSLPSDLYPRMIPILRFDPGPIHAHGALLGQR
jgi:hypothetical protein